MSKCSKRVIIHPGINLEFAVAAAENFDQNYVLADGDEEPIKTGVYHRRVYEEVGSSQDSKVSVYHTNTSIIVQAESEVPSVEVLEEQEPAKMPLPTGG